MYINEEQKNSAISFSLHLRAKCFLLNGTSKRPWVVLETYWNDSYVTVTDSVMQGIFKISGPS